MAKKKLNPMEDPPTASSNHEYEVDPLSGEEEEVNKQISDDSSSDEDEDDLLSPVIIPPPKHAVASGSKKAMAVTIASPSKTGSKRPSEKISSKKKVHSKRSKKVSEDSENKKPLFQRLWSEEDEISLLQGMIDFKADTGKSPYEDMDGFYEFTKKFVSFDASKNQSVDKIRSLKKKYMGKVHKGVETLPKAHDMECLKLSKYIWGSHGMALKPHVNKSEKKLDSLEANGEKVEEERDVLVNGDNEEEEEDREMFVNGKKVEVDKEVLVNGDSKSHGVMRESDWFEDSFLVGTIASLGVDERFVKQKWSMVDVETKKKLEDKWKSLQSKEMELVLHKADFMREVGSVIAEAS